jgi:SAM-dependent methyltransferase
MRELMRRFPAAMPYKFKAIRRRFGDRPFAMLDIGAGNHSATRTRSWFPRCRYTGLDRDRHYHNDAADFALMDAFHEVDLTALDFGAIPDAAYDVIMMAHVIEHLGNGDEVVRGLCPKLRPGGLFYLEFPGPRSLKLPSMRGTLNFHDDDTHVRLWTRAEVERALTAGGLQIVESGTRRDAFRIAVTPLRVVVSFARRGWVPGSAFWDLLGFADRVVAERPPA